MNTVPLPAHASPGHGFSVCAVLVESDEALEAALVNQHSQPGAVVRAGDVSTGVTRAILKGTDWIWLLDGSALPEPDSLSHLVSAAREFRSAAPAVLISKVVAGNGTLAPEHAPWPRRGEVELALVAFQHHAVPIRAAPGGSLLVSGPAASAQLPPRPGLPARVALLGWTARILRGAPGLLVPASSAIVRPAAARAGSAPSSEAAEEIRGAFSLVSAKAWAPKEVLRLGAETLGRAAVVIGSRQAPTSAVVRAAARGLRAPA